MTVFDTAKFNLQPFNISSIDIDDVSDTVNIACMIYSMVYRGGNDYEEAEINAVTASSITPCAANFVSADWSGMVQQNTKCSVNALDNVAASASVSCAFRFIIDAFDEIHFAPTVQGKFELSMSSLHALAIPAAFGQDCYLSFNYPAAAHEISALVDSQIASILFSVRNAEFEIDIPPGSTLVIDSENYVVLLDGEDVIWCQSGEWLFLNRNTYDVVFDFVGGTETEKKVLYTERWL